MQENKEQIQKENNKPKSNNMLKFLKFFLTLSVIAICIGLIIYLFPIIANLTTQEGREYFKNYISDTGFYGMMVLFGLQVAQIALVVLPGEPLEFLAGMCYGTVGGTVFITVSVAITTATIFFAVRKFGRKYVYSFFSKEKIEKIENSKIFKKPEKLEFILIILFLIPGTPKDLLVYLGGLLPVKPLRFILISTFARFPSVISSTIAGANVINGNFTFSIMVYLVTFVLTSIVVLLINKFDKEKLTSDAINSVIK